jgi:hypothetical protein
MEGQKPPTKRWLSSTNLREGVIWEDLDEDEEASNTLSFMEQAFRPKP